MRLCYFFFSLPRHELYNNFVIVHLCTIAWPHLPHTVAQPTKWRFLPKNLSQLVIFVIVLWFTWSWKFDSQSQFSMSKISFIILIFVPFKIIRLGEQLKINHFLITSFFEVQGVPILKIQKFLSGMLILMQKPCNFVNFVPLLWKLYNPYCHATGDPQIVRILCSQGIVLLQKSY